MLIFVIYFLLVTQYLLFLVAIITIDSKYLPIKIFCLIEDELSEIKIIKMFHIHSLNSNYLIRKINGFKTILAGTILKYLLCCLGTLDEQIRASYSVLSVLPNSKEHQRPLTQFTQEHLISTIQFSVCNLSSTVKPTFILLCGIEK